MRIQKYLQESPAFALEIAARVLSTRFNRELEREGLHFWEASLLMALFFEAPHSVRPSELARTFRVNRSQISHCVSALEKQKLLERRIAAEDARGYSLTVTREGKAKAARLVKLFDAWQNRFESLWNSTQRHRLMEQLHELESLFADTPAKSR